MKILISGSFCSGKTTLAKDLIERLPDVFMLTEPVRDLAGIYTQELIARPEARSYLLIRQLLIEAQADEKYQYLICDAGIESNLAHDRLYGIEHESDIVEKFGHRRYDMVFYCEYKEIAIENDGFRITDYALREDLDSMIRSELNNLKYTYVTLTGPPQDRVDIALNCILKKSFRK